MGTDHRLLQPPDIRLTNVIAFTQTLSSLFPDEIAGQVPNCSDPLVGRCLLSYHLCFSAPGRAHVYEELAQYFGLVPHEFLRYWAHYADRRILDVYRVLQHQARQDADTWPEDVDWLFEQ